MVEISKTFMHWCGIQGLDGRLDFNTVHEACEVLSGTKWTAVKWMERMFGLKRGPLSYKIATIPGRC